MRYNAWITVGCLMSVMVIVLIGCETGDILEEIIVEEVAEVNFNLQIPNLAPFGAVSDITVRVTASPEDDTVLATAPLAIQGNIATGKISVLVGKNRVFTLEAKDEDDFLIGSGTTTADVIPGQTITVDTTIHFVTGDVILNGKWEEPPWEKPGDELKPGERVPQVLNMAAIISSVDVATNTVFVKSPEQEKEIKLILSDETEIIQLKFPFDPANPPAGETTFTPERIPIGIEDLEVGKHILVETRTTIYGKTEIDDVVRIQVLP